MRFRNLNRHNTGLGEAGLRLTVVCCVCRYLTCTNYDFSYDRSKNLRPKRNIKNAMNHEIMLYGIAQKEQLGFDKAVEECSAAPPLKPSSHSHTLTRSFPRSQSTA